MIGLAILQQWYVSVFLPPTHILNPLILKGYISQLDPTLLSFTEGFPYSTTHSIQPKQCHSKSYLSHSIFRFRLCLHDISRLYSTFLSPFPSPTEDFLHSTADSIWPKDCCSKFYLFHPIFRFGLHHHNRHSYSIQPPIPKCNHDFVHEVGIWWN